MDGIGVKRLVPSSLFILGMLLVITGFGCTAIPSPSPAQAIPTPTPPPLPRIAFTALSTDNTQFEGTYTVNADGTDLKLLTKMGDQAAWSPDGKQIALRYIAGDRRQIWLVDKNGNSPHPATPPELTGLQSTPRWSPDGKQIAFVYDGPFPTNLQAKEAIYIIQLDQGTVIPIPCLPFANCTDPHWSPDGKQIIYTVKQDPVPGHPIGIYITDVTEASEPRLLQKNANSPFSFPRGDLIGFGIEGKTQTFVMNSKGEEVRTFMEQGPVDVELSPDGTRFAFAGGIRPGGLLDICIINADGSGLHCLENPATGDTAPVWSPDGEQIAFVGWREGRQEIYVTNVDGTNVRRLIDSPFQQIAPAWSPR